jgi:5'-3' exonuclease
MGIERFFSSIQENNITNLRSSFSKDLEKRLDTNHLYIDFNSIVYIVSNKLISDFNYLLYKVITNNLDDKNAKRIVVEYNLKEISLTSMKEYGLNKNDIMDKLVTDKVIEYVLNIFNNYVNPDMLELIYIAIDGVPLKSKMIEQRKRRYMGIVIDKLKERIFNKYENELSELPDENRYLFEINKIKWNRIKITPGTPFMDLLVGKLTSKKFNDKIRIICPNVKEYIFSGPYEPGEGEKKIVDRLRSSDQKKSNYTVYSPDSDVTLLCLLLNTKLNGKKIEKLNILRHNQQKNNYNVIDIDTLSTNLYEYVYEKVETNKRKKLLDQDSIINDIVFILTIFGNDFVPKIQAFNVKYDFTKIINKYTEVLINHLDSKGVQQSLVVLDKNNDGHKRINFDFFKDIIKVLKFDEGGNLQKVYMTSHYKNYDKLKRLMGADHNTFTDKLNKFLSMLRHFNDDIRQLNGEDLLKKWNVTNNIDFFDKLKKMVKLGNTQFDIRKATPKELINSYYDFYKRQNKLPNVAIYFSKYTRNLDSDFHRTKIERSLDRLDSNLKITKYDEEIYKLDNMLDEYQKKLNSYPMDLGHVRIDTRSYTWKTEKIVDSVKKYYKEMFNIDDIDAKNAKMNRLASEYISGIIWVFNFYFNNFNEKENRETADLWFYPYENAPLLTQIFNYLKDVKGQQFITDEEKKLNNYKINRSNYFNCLEHMMFVIPANQSEKYIGNIVPDEYKNFSKTFNYNENKYYVELDKIVNNIWKNPMKSDEIDCKGILFLNKCNLKQIHVERDINLDKHFISEIRKIKLLDNTKKRMGTYNKDTDNINKFDFSENKNDDKMIARLSKMDDHTEKYYLNKKKYIETGNKKYKKLYKKYKSLIFFG